LRGQNSVGANRPRVLKSNGVINAVATRDDGRLAIRSTHGVRASSAIERAIRVARARDKCPGSKVETEWVRKSLLSVVSEA